MTKACMNCIYCSESYPSFIDSCDVNDREIKDVENEWCDKFIAIEGEEDNER